MINVDRKSLKREWYGGEGELRFLLEPTTEGSVALERRQLEEASAGVSAALHPGNPVVAEQWLLTTAGWSGLHLPDHRGPARPPVREA